VVDSKGQWGFTTGGGGSGEVFWGWNGWWWVATGAGGLEWAVGGCGRLVGGDAGGCGGARYAVVGRMVLVGVVEGGDVAGGGGGGFSVFGCGEFVVLEAVFIARDGVFTVN